MSEGAGQLPWSIRLYESRSLPPLFWFLLVTVVYVALWFLFARLEAERPPPTWGPWSWSEAIVRGLLLGYTPALMVWSRRQALRTLDELRPSLRLSDESFPEIAAAMVRPGRWLIQSGAVLALLWPVIALSTPRLGGVSDESTLGRMGWVGITFLVGGWLVFRAIAQDVHVARSLSRLGAEALEIDLLAPERLEPLHRWSLRAVALWVIWFCIMSLFFVGPGPANYVNLAGILPLLIVSGTAFFLPLYGAHRRIREAKQAELAWLDERLREERDALREGRATRGEARLADLGAYRGLVASAREWPFDATALLRFMLYTAVGVGSWLGAAIVERGLDVLLE